MKSLNKNQIRIVGLLIFIIILLFIIYYYKNNVKENDSIKNEVDEEEILKLEYKESFNEDDNSKCNIIKLKNENHKTDPKSDNYTLMIEENQPFEPPSFLDRRDQRNVDTILEIKQSKNYLWCLNEGRNRIVVSKSDQLNKKKFKDIFTPQNNDNLVDSFYITCYGVHKSFCHNEEWCAVFFKKYKKNRRKRR